jgi:GNAT superfamily N-acetyltransferase
MGSLATMPGLERLAAGCVIQRVAPAADAGECDEWIREIQNRIGGIVGARPRVYLQASYPQLESALYEAGFQCETEIGLLNFAPEALVETDIRLHQVANDADWAAKRALHGASGTGPDGHENAPGLWVDLEQRKSQSGGLELYLVMRNEDVIGALGLMAQNSILRLKNLVMHPDYRGSGLGAEAVRAGCAEAARRGYATVGVFALEQHGTLAFYESCGFQPVTTQTEWTMGA